MVFKKNKNGSLLVIITTDRKLNVLSEEIIESTESIDYSSLAECFAESYIIQNDHES